MRTCAARSTGSSALTFPDKSAKLSMTGNAVLYTTMSVHRSTEQSMTATQKLNVQQNTKTTVNITGKVKELLKFGLPFLEHVNPTRTTVARMCLSRSVPMSPSKNVQLSTNKNVPTSRIKNATEFPSRTAKLFTRRSRRESARGCLKKYVMAGPARLDTVGKDRDLVVLASERD